MIQLQNHSLHLSGHLVRRLHDTNTIPVIDTYMPKLYKPTEAIFRTHLLPRFGFPKNIGVLWEGNDDQVETYIIGILVGSIFIVGVMAVFLFIMAVLKILGYRRVGFWCGHFEYHDTEEDCVRMNRVDSRDNNDDDVANSMKNGDSTGIIAVRTIGCGEFNDRNSHVSIAIKGDVVEAPELPKADTVDDMTHRIDGDSEDGIPVDKARQRVNVDMEDETISDPKPKPAIQIFRLKVARIDSEGNVIALRPKPVPKNIFLKVNAVRIMFIFCGVGAAISAGLFYGLGVIRFKQSLVSTRSGITHFNTLALKSINVTDNLLDVQQKVENQLNTTEFALDNIGRSCDLDSFVNATNLVQHYGIVKKYFITISNTTQHLLNGFGDNMMNIIEATTTVYDEMHVANIIFSFLVLIMCIMIIIIFIMIIGVAFAAYDIENCFTCFMRRVILLPIFVLQLILATLFSAVFFIVALAGSDFCVQPDHHAKRMFARVARGTDDTLSPLFTLVLFYLSGCRKVNDEKDAQSIYGLVNGMDSMLIVAHDMFGVFNTLTPQDILTYCNVTQELIQHFDELGMTMHNVTHQLHDALEATLDILSCRSIHPVYSNLVHDAVCIDAVGGVEAIFSTMLSVSVLSMMMLALRAALYPIQLSQCPVTSND